jgi:hypothetical protein
MTPLPSQSAAQAFRTALALFDAGVDLMRQNLKRAHPEADDEQVDRLLAAWLHHRPGAEFGDCPGRVVDVVTRSA